MQGPGRELINGVHRLSAAAFLMAVIALSLPEMIILKQVPSLRPGHAVAFHLIEHPIDAT